MSNHQSETLLSMCHVSDTSCQETDNSVSFSNTFIGEIKEFFPFSKSNLY